MSASVRTEFEQRMVHEGSLHAAFQAEASTPDAGALQALAERNTHVLVAIALLEERPRAERDDAGPLAPELARLDGKLNLLIEIVNHLLLPAAALPPRQQLRFNGVGAELPLALLPPGATLGRLRLHLDACLALPLELACRVEAVRGDSAFLAFDAFGDAVEEGLDRYVFRQHRRKLADVRQSAP